MAKSTLQSANQIERELNMKIRVCLFCLLLLFSLVDCKRKDIAELAANDYCECLTREGSPKTFVLSREICDAELSSKYYYYRLYSIDSKYESERQITQSARDSIVDFISKFRQFLRNKCCYEILMCEKDSVFKYKEMPDSILSPKFNIKN